MRLPKNDHLAALTVMAIALTVLAVIVVLTILTKGFFLVGLMFAGFAVLMYIFVLDVVIDSRSDYHSGNTGPW